jgi:predicted DNA-binding mobile mystery protein A
MPSKNLRLVRQQLDATLDRFDPVSDLAPPPKGWIHTVRKALGMSGRQLAGRLGLSKQSVARMERDEIEGALSIKTMRRVAEGLDCVLVYGIVPRTSLEKIVHDRARTIVGGRLDHHTNQTARLADQDLDPALDEEIIRGMIEDLVDGMPADFWDKP